MNGRYRDAALCGTALNKVLTYKGGGGEECKASYLNKTT